PYRGEVLMLTCAAAVPSALARARQVLVTDRVVIAGEDEVVLPLAVTALLDRGLSRVLCEGGPQLLADVAASGVLDEMCQTVVPLLAGGTAPRITKGTPADLELRPRLLLESHGTLLHRWIRPDACTPVSDTYSRRGPTDSGSTRHNGPVLGRFHHLLLTFAYGRSLGAGHMAQFPPTSVPTGQSGGGRAPHPQSLPLLGQR